MSESCIRYIDLDGDKFPMTFNVGAMEDISEKFGGVQTLFTEMAGDDEAKRYKAIKASVDILVRWGQVLARKRNMECGPDLPCDASDLLMPADLKTVIPVIEEVIRACTERTIEATPPKN